MYSDELAKEICRLIATTQYSLVKILILNAEFPSYSTIMEWLDEKSEYFKPYFSDNYIRARANKGDFMADYMIDVAEQAQEDVLTRKVPASKSSAYLAAVRLNIDVLKFTAVKMKPRKYGDDQRIDLTSKDEKITMNVAWLGRDLPKEDDSTKP